MNLHAGQPQPENNPGMATPNNPVPNTPASPGTDTAMQSPSTPSPITDATSQSFGTPDSPTSPNLPNTATDGEFEAQIPWPFIQASCRPLRCPDDGTGSQVYRSLHSFEILQLNSFRVFFCHARSLYHFCHASRHSTPLQISWYEIEIRKYKRVMAECKYNLHELDVCNPDLICLSHISWWRVKAKLQSLPVSAFFICSLFAVVAISKIQQKYGCNCICRPLSFLLVFCCEGDVQKTGLEVVPLRLASLRMHQLHLRHAWSALLLVFPCLFECSAFCSCNYCEVRKIRLPWAKWEPGIQVLHTSV